MSFEQMGRTLDNAMANLGKSLTKTMKRLTERMKMAMRPDVYKEGKQLAVDVSERGYDLVERNDVRVTREDSAGVVEYHDGSGWEDVTRYDLEKVSWDAPR